MTERFDLKKMLKELEEDQTVRKSLDHRLSRDGLKKFVASTRKGRRSKASGH